MKKTSLFFMACLVTLACCFTSCQKDETEKESATLNDFVGTYRVNITEQGALSAITGGVESNATLYITAAEAQAYGITIATSSKIAKFRFESDDEHFNNAAWSEVINSTYGYVKNGYLVMVCADTVQGKTVIYPDKMAYKANNVVAAFDAYYASDVLSFSILNLVADDVRLRFEVKRTSNTVRPVDAE